VYLVKNNTRNVRYLSVLIAPNYTRSIMFHGGQTQTLTDAEYGSVINIAVPPVWTVTAQMDSFHAGTVDEVKAIFNSMGGGGGVPSFNYVLDASVTSDDIGKLMMALPPSGGGGFLDEDFLPYRAAVNQEVVGLPSIFYFQIGAAGPAPEGCVVHIYFNSMDVGLAVGVDFQSDPDPDTQYANFKNAVLANSTIMQYFDVSDRPDSFDMLLFTAKDLGNGGAYYENTSWASISFDQYPQTPGPFNRALGKLVSIADDGYGVIAPYAGQSFIASGAIDKNAQIVGTNDGKVKARDLIIDNSNDWVIGLAKEAVADEESVTLNYCPRTPAAWYSSDLGNGDLPTSIYEALDMWTWWWWD
jgi:hypothetical protein